MLEKDAAYQQGYNSGYQAGRRSKPPIAGELSTLDKLDNTSQLNDIVKQLTKLVDVIQDWYERQFGKQNR